MDIILKNGIVKYHHNIKKIKNKLQKIKSKMLINDKHSIKKYGGGTTSEDIIAGSINIKSKVRIIDDLFNKFTVFDQQLQQYIDEIDRLHTDSTTVPNYKIIEDKLGEIQTRTNQIINAHDLYGTTIPDPEILDITQINDYKSISLIYKGLINKHAELVLQLEAPDNQNLDFLYTKINESILGTIASARTFIENIREVILAIGNTAGPLEDLNRGDIVLAADGSYNYAKKITLTAEGIMPINVARYDALVDLTKDVLSKLKTIGVENGSGRSSFLDTINWQNMYTEITKIEKSSLTAPTTTEPATSSVSATTEPATSSVSATSLRRGGGNSNRYIIQTAGNPELINNMAQLSKLIAECNVSMNNYIDALSSYKILKIQENNYILYLLLITLSPKFIKNMMTYDYINKGILQFYLSIIQSILEQIKIKNKRKDIVYFHHNHYIMLTNMQRFINFLISEINTLDVIDINRCTGSIKKNFVLLNHFKDILESYHEVWQSKVTVYSRINDWPDGSLPRDRTKLMFSKDPADARLMIVNRKACKDVCVHEQCASMTDGITKIKFSEVFDTENFTRNNDITKYMTLETQLSKKKGVMLMTYGYSGTGKTYTLFGSSGTGSGSSVVEPPKQGMLQATLDNIRGLTEVRFRVLELYGLGVQYPHYWMKKKDINQTCLLYELGINESNELFIKKEDRNSDIVSCFSDRETNFIVLGEHLISKVFKSFDIFIDDLDARRKRDGRIRITANNPESSRSIIIYEFHLLIDDSYVPFVIIDLPGREEIVETYVDNYLGRDFIPDTLKTPFHQSILSSMSINPLGLSFLVPSVIFETFNGLNLEIRRNIIEKSIEFEMKDDADDDESVDFTEHTSSDTRGPLYSENLGNIDRGGGVFTPITLGYIYNFANIQSTYMFDMIRNPQGSRSLQTNIVKIKETPRNRNQVDVNINSIQYQGVLALHLMNRLILLNRFDIIEKIYRNIISTYFRVSVVVGSRPTDKRAWLYRYLDTKKVDKTPDNELDDLIDGIANFRTYMAPFEGIYINESIMGLIKVLAKNILGRDDAYIKSHLMSEQDSSLNFKDQKQFIRKTSFELYKDSPSSDTEVYENIFRSTESLKGMIKNDKKSYSSQKIFNYDNPSIESIINIYCSPSGILKGGKTVTIEPVTDFKLFYLFSNTQMKKKCIHQWKLLNNTTSFITAIDLNYD